MFNNKKEPKNPESGLTSKHGFCESIRGGGGFIEKRQSRKANLTHTSREPWNRGGNGTNGEEGEGGCGGYEIYHPRAVRATAGGAPPPGSNPVTRAPPGSNPVTQTQPSLLYKKIAFPTTNSGLSSWSGDFQLCKPEFIVRTQKAPWRVGQRQQLAAARLEQELDYLHVATNGAHPQERALFCALAL